VVLPSAVRPARPARAILLRVLRAARRSASSPASSRARSRPRSPRSWLIGCPRHGVDVLLRIYAKCVVGQDELAKRRISEALRQD
jgi:hypothetical protein